MKKIIFLILHYYTIEDTIKCINSIEKLDYKNKQIVVVDNGSPNNSGTKLQKLYKKSENIHIILSKENLGFARGNNLGFKYAKEKLKADFIVMCNNDIIIIQNDFCQQIIKEYSNSNFALLGPKIYLKDESIYAYNDTLPTLNNLKTKLFDTKLFYYLNKIHLRYVYAIYYRIKKIFIKEKKVDTAIRKENVILHGCCLIFSKKYINKFNGIDDRTFLYYEEPLLYLRIKINQMKSVYNPDMYILHNEGISTNKSIKNKRKKIDFKLKYEIDSLKILISELETNMGDTYVK